MSYLHIDSSTMANFKQCVISLWFRVPQKSIDACFKANSAWYDSPANNGSAPVPPMLGIIPVLIMGPEGNGRGPVSTTTSRVLWANITGISWGGGETSSVSTEDRPAPNTLVITTIDTLNEGASFFTVSDQAFVNVDKTTAAGDPPPTNPTFIGVDCTIEGQAYLRVNFETAQQPTLASVDYEIQSITPGSQIGPGAFSYFGPSPGPPGPCDAFASAKTKIVTTFQGVGQNTVITPLDPIHWVQYPQCDTTGTAPVQNYVDISMVGAPESGNIGGNFTNIPVDANEWHHVLVSLDLRTIATKGWSSLSPEPSKVDVSPQVSGYSDLYCAFDDVNRTGWDLLDDFVGGEDQNATLTDLAYEIINTASTIEDQVNFTGPSTTIEMPLPAYALSDPVIPCKGSAIGLPGTTQFVDDIFDVEHAEFQMFTGIKVDTGDVKIRRYFVDADGKPVFADAKKKASEIDGSTSGQSGSIEGLGQKPDILLHGTSKWQKGQNTGSLGVGNDGKPIPSGQFIPKAYIAPYKPDPSLHGPQGAPQIAMARRPVRLRRKPEPVG